MYSLFIIVLAILSSIANGNPMRIPETLSTRKASCSSTLISCQSTIPTSQYCCAETPQGLIITPQFWDTNPTTGPSNSWTIHGSWPNNCDDSYKESCDPSRYQSDIASVLQANGRGDLVTYMNEYWVNNAGTNAEFWSHEWNTHGTCFSTIVPACLPPNAPKGLDTTYFFEWAINTFKSLPTYQFLSKAGITPNNSKTYALKTLIAAIKVAHGYVPALDCNGKSLNSISYFFHLQGNIINGTLIPIDAFKAGSCPSSGIVYPVKK